MGVMDWLEKPIDRERLLSVIRRVSRRSNNSRPRILYVEDDADLVQFVLNLLRDMAEVVTVGTLAAADRAVTSDEFDLVILDVQLPDGSGIDLLKRLKNGGSNSTPVVIFSAKEVNKVVADRVEAALIKSRTTNDILIDTIKGLINGENRQVNRS